MLTYVTVPCWTSWMVFLFRWRYWVLTVNILNSFWSHQTGDRPVNYPSPATSVTDKQKPNGSAKLLKTSTNYSPTSEAGVLKCMSCYLKRLTTGRHWGPVRPSSYRLSSGERQMGPRLAPIGACRARTGARLDGIWEGWAKNFTCRWPDPNLTPR